MRLTPPVYSMSDFLVSLWLIACVSRSDFCAGALTPNQLWGIKNRLVSLVSGRLSAAVVEIRAWQWFQTGSWSWKAEFHTFKSVFFFPIFLSWKYYSHKLFWLPLSHIQGQTVAYSISIFFFVKQHLFSFKHSIKISLSGCDRCFSLSRADPPLEEGRLMEKRGEIIRREKVGKGESEMMERDGM